MEYEFHAIINDGREKYKFKEMMRHWSSSEYVFRIQSKSLVILSSDDDNRSFWMNSFYLHSTHSLILKLFEVRDFLSLLLLFDYPFNIHNIYQHIS